jgi:hypothetical protein
MRIARAFGSKATFGILKTSRKKIYFGENWGGLSKSREELIHWLKVARFKLHISVDSCRCISYPKITEAQKEPIQIPSRFFWLDMMVQDEESSNEISAASAMVNSENSTRIYSRSHGGQHEIIRFRTCTFLGG